jgi:hypothetical protein
MILAADHSGCTDKNSVNIQWIPEAVRVLRHGVGD